MGMRVSYEELLSSMPCGRRNTPHAQKRMPQLETDKITYILSTVYSNYTNHTLGSSTLRISSGVRRRIVNGRSCLFILSYRPVDGTAHAEHLPGQEPVEEADGQLSLVVGRDGHVHVLEGGVAVAEGDDRDVHVRRLLHHLVHRSTSAHRTEGVGDRRTGQHRTNMHPLCWGNLGVQPAERRFASRSKKEKNGFSIMGEECFGMKQKGQPPCLGLPTRKPQP